MDDRVHIDAYSLRYVVGSAWGKIRQTKWWFLLNGCGFVHRVSPLLLCGKMEKSCSPAVETRR
jgi:hypothetical protein